MLSPNFVFPDWIRMAGVDDLAPCDAPCRRHG